VEDIIRMNTSPNLPWRMMCAEMRRRRPQIITALLGTTGLSVCCGMDDEFVVWLVLASFGAAVLFGRLAAYYRRGTVAGNAVPELLLTDVHSHDFAISLSRVYVFMFIAVVLVPAAIAYLVDGMRSHRDLEMTHFYALLWLAMALTLAFWASAFSRRTALTTWIGLPLVALGWWLALMYKFSAAWSGRTNGILYNVVDVAFWLSVYGTPTIAFVQTVLFIRKCFLSYTSFLRTQLP
jgi:hypothetical protein